MTSYSGLAFRLSKYIEGYYCKDEDSINCIKSERTRALLNVLSKSFPLGQTEADLQQHEDIKDIIAPGTVEGSLTILRRSKFLIRDKKKVRSQKTNRLVSKHLFENMNSLLDM